MRFRKVDKLYIIHNYNPRSNETLKNCWLLRGGGQPLQSAWPLNILFFTSSLRGDLILMLKITKNIKSSHSKKSPLLVWRSSSCRCRYRFYNHATSQGFGLLPNRGGVSALNKHQRCCNLWFNLHQAGRTCGKLVSSWPSLLSLNFLNTPKFQPKNPQAKMGGHKYQILWGKALFIIYRFIYLPADLHIVPLLRKYFTAD